MATQSIPLTAEFEEFAAALVESGRYPNSTEVLHAAMNALRLAEADEQATNDALLALAEEGEASGEAEGDVIGRIRVKYGLRTPVAG
jgi:putative addiction module CopG family antidote